MCRKCSQFTVSTFISVHDCYWKRLDTVNELTVKDSRFFPEVTNVKPCVSIATPTRCTCSSIYLTLRRKKRIKITESRQSLSNLFTNIWWKRIFALHTTAMVQSLALEETTEHDIRTYQFMKLLLPAEWFPMSRTVIFFRGANIFRSNSVAIRDNPEKMTRELLI